MNPSQTPLLIRRKRVQAIALLVVFALIAIGLIQSFSTSPELDALGLIVSSSAEAQWNTKIRVTAGAITLTIARTCLSFVDLPPEARAILHAVRRGELGIYRLRDSPASLDRGGMLTAVQAAMTERGWDRIITVMDENDLVAVYAPEGMRSPHKVRICVLVFDGRDLILASARANLKPLFDLIANQPQWRARKFDRCFIL